MKRSLLLPLLLLAAIAVKAQQVQFKLAFAPKTSYTINKETKMNMTITPPAALAAAMGGNGIVSDMTMHTVSTVTTAGRDQNKMIPVKFSTKATDMKMTLNGQEIPTGSMPTDAANMQVFGKYSPDGKLIIDSVAGKKMNDSVSAVMSKVVEAVQNGLKFPDHPLKIGDTFTQEMPLALPLPGITGGNTMNLKMTYKLLSIANNIAAFDFTETVDVAMNQAIQSQNLQMNMNGLGSGSLSYDIAKQFFITMTNNLNMTFDLNINGINMQGKGIVSTVDKVEIAGN